MIERAVAEGWARDWIDAWNRHDLDGVMAHYAEALEFVSPLVARRLGRADGTIRTRAALRDYFAASLGPGSTLRFDLRAVLVGVGSYTVLYANHRGQEVAETAFPDAAGRIARAYVHHGG
jgi:ketosteroid isomerase-like protein